MKYEMAEYPRPGSQIYQGLSGRVTLSISRLKSSSATSAYLAVVLMFLCPAARRTAISALRANLPEED